LIWLKDALDKILAVKSPDTKKWSEEEQEWAEEEDNDSFLG